jgi:transglutaminase-like putative cysteine protease
MNAARFLEVQHTTTYRYAKPVRFGQHRVMFRPRTGHDIHVLDASIETNVPSKIDWVQDTQSNWVTLVTPSSGAAELKIDCRFRISHRGVRGINDLPLAPHARRWPFDYSADERRDLGALLDRHYPDPEGRLFEWSRPFLAPSVRPDTRELLTSIAASIKAQFRYESRDDEGTQTPDETLQRGAGSCRDFALLMIEVVRRLGIAARFVSGYLYDPDLDQGADEGQEVDVSGAGATHAWLHAYLPGAGWVPFDPTNALFGGSSLIRVAYARDPSLATPLTGSWFGDPGAFTGMEVAVSVRRVPRAEAA